MGQVTQTFTTDLTDELISLELADGSTVGYTHDAQGNRTSRTVDGLLDATWAWDDLSSLPMRIGEYDATGALSMAWLADPTSSTGASLAQTSGGSSSWLLNDPFANTVATMSTTGNTVSGTRTMDAFGVERTSATGSLADASVGFAGQYLDDATGLYDMRARDYDPSSGRFTANDSVAVPTGRPYVAGYTYAYGNSLMFNDVSGLTPCASTGAGEAACLAAYYKGTGFSSPQELRLKTILGIAAVCLEGMASALGGPSGNTAASPPAEQFSVGKNPYTLPNGMLLHEDTPTSIVDLLANEDFSSDFSKQHYKDFVEMNNAYFATKAYPQYFELREGEKAPDLADAIYFLGMSDYTFVTFADLSLSPNLSVVLANESTKSKAHFGMTKAQGFTLTLATSWANYFRGAYVLKPLRQYLLDQAKKAL